MSAIAPVLQRIAAIESRFRPGSPPVDLPVTGHAGNVVSEPSFAFDIGAPLGADQVPEVPGIAAPTTAIDVGSLGTATVATSALAPPAPYATRLDGGVGPSTPFAAEFEAAGRSHGVPPRLLAAVGWVESRYQVDAVSPDGAIGLMQIMPMTASELGVDPTDPRAAIDGAARLLALHFERFGSWDLALAAYHSGGGAVARAGNQAPPRAAEYVRRVHQRLELA